MHAVRKAAEGAAGDGQEDPGALVVAAVGEGRAGDKEQRTESVRQEVHGGESAGEGAGANQITDRYLVALARQHGFSLATLDQPLAKGFANETGLVELVHCNTYIGKTA